MKTTIEIPDELYTKVKTEAAIRGISVKEILIHSLQVELAVGFEDYEIQKTKESKFPLKKLKKNLQIHFSKLTKKMKSIPQAKILKKINFDPVDILLEDRAKRNDFLLY